MYDYIYPNQIMLVVELMHKGNLKDYLPTLRPRYEVHYPITKLVNTSSVGPADCEISKMNYPNYYLASQYKSPWVCSISLQEVLFTET